MKRILAMAICVALLATMAITGSIAYLQDTDGTANVMTMGNVDIEQNEQQRKADDSLEDFDNTQALYPAVYNNNTRSDPTTTEPGADAVRPSSTDANGFWTGVAGAMDKIVSVTNVGKSDAYIRTWFAFEADDTTDDTNTEKSGLKYIHINWNNFSEKATKTSYGVQEINGDKYAVFCVTYRDAYKQNETTPYSLLQVCMDKAADNKYVAQFGDTYEILVLSQGVQTANFNSLEEAFKLSFGEYSVDNIKKWFGGLGAVSTSEEFETAITADQQNIVIYLENDVTFDLHGHSEVMGGESTETITIIGNGHTLTFKNNDTNCNDVAVKNGAKLILKDVKLSNTYNGNNTWDAHDIVFAGAVELNNVTSDKALAFFADATLKDVTVEDNNTTDTYAIWIQTNGQTVNIDGLNVKMYGCVGGRGIAIKNEYADADKGVNLTVKNATFQTAKKAAILVTSNGTVNIGLDNVDISGVKADTTNHVWIDEKVTSTGNVTVTGGSVVKEGDTSITPNNNIVTSTTELSTALSSSSSTSSNITLTVGTYTIPTAAKGKTITLVGGGENTVIDCTAGTGIEKTGDSTLYFENLTINAGTGGDNKNYKGFQHAKKVTYKNCVINNQLTLYSDSTFENCIFNLGTDEYIWTYSADTATFENCTFNTKGKCILVYVEQWGNGGIVNINNCKMNASQKASGKAAVEINSEWLSEGKSFVVNINNSTAMGFDGGSISGNSLWNNKYGRKTSVNVNGVAQTLNEAPEHTEPIPIIV